MQGISPKAPSFQELADQFRAKNHSAEPATAEAVLNADFKKAQDIQVPETPEFFNRNDITNDITNETKADQNQDTNIAADSNSFTVDQPGKPKSFLNVNWKKPINILPGKPVDFSLEKSVPYQEKQIGTTEQMQFRVDLRNAVDQFNKITAQAARLVVDIENKGGNEGEIPRINITQVLEDPRLHDPRVSSSVKSRFLHELTEKLKNENSKVETDQYKNVLQEIEPAKEEVSKALEALLAQTKNSLDVKRIRTTLADIIFETSETTSFKQDLVAICMNKEAELEEQERESTVEEKKQIDQLPNVSKGIIDNINKIGEEKENEGLSADSNQGDKTVVTNTLQADQLSGSRISSLQSGMTNSEGSKTDPSSLAYKNDIVPKKSTETDANIVNDEKPTNDIKTDLATEAALPAEPKFEEFIKFGPKGNKVSADTEIHDEVSLSPSKGDVNLAVLANLKRGDGESNETGVVNFTTEDINNRINPTHAIRARVEDLKNKPQNLPPGSSDMFGSSNVEPIMDVNNKSIDQPNVTDLFIDKTSVLAEPPISTGMSPDGSLGGNVIKPEETQGAQKSLAQNEDVVEKTEELISEERGLSDQKIVGTIPQELPGSETSEISNKELETIKEVKPTADIPTTEKGPDLVAESQNVTEPMGNIPVANSKAEPGPKKSRLSTIFGSFLNLGAPKANEARELDDKVGSVRAATTEKLAEQKEM